MSVRRIKWVLGTRLILSLYIPWSLFFVSCTTWHSHPSCSLLLAQQLISRRLHPKSARTLLTPLVYFKVAASASYWAPLSPSRHANTERFVFCSVAPCLIPFPESLSYFSNSGLVRSCQHPFPWEPVNKQEAGIRASSVLFLRPIPPPHSWNSLLNDASWGRLSTPSVW